MAKKVDFLGIFQKLEEKNEAIKALKEEIKALEKESELLESQLRVSIPANGVKDGIQHIVTTRSSVAYAKALEKVKEELVPKTKAAEVAAIVSEFTSVSEQHKFKAV